MNIPAWAESLLAEYGFTFTRTLGTHGVRVKSPKVLSALDVWENKSWRFVDGDFTGKTIDGLRAELEKRCPKPVIENLSAYAWANETEIDYGFYCLIDGTPWNFSRNQGWIKIPLPEVSR